MSKRLALILFAASLGLGPAAWSQTTSPRPTATSRANPPRQSSIPRSAASVPVRATDPKVQRTQIPTEVVPLPLPSPTQGDPGNLNGLQAGLNELEGAGQSISLQAALYGTITNNPDLVALRNSNVASPEAVEVARHFPTTLNPTVWIDYRPITLIPRDTFASSGSGTGTGTGQTTNKGPFYHYGQNYILFSIRQPIELGHQTTHRHEVARAALNQQEWTVVQAELVALVQTYRFFQTAAYRREKLRVAKDLSAFNDRLVLSLEKRLEANQVAAADVVLARVENESTRQQVDVARQDYANALADLRNQVGLPEQAASAEPLGEFVLPANVPPLEEAALVQMALQSRPEIHAARAQVRGALAAVNLARGDRIPTPVVGPQYAMDEAGIQYIGLILVSPIPILNSGKPLVRQREADLRRAQTNLAQIEKRTVIQVRAAAAKWNAANRLVSQTGNLTGSLRGQVDRMERLFDANQTDLSKLLQARQRLIQLENARLDALWQATQSQSDLLLALGVPNLIAALHEPGPAAMANAPTTPATAPAAPPTTAAATPAATRR